MIERMTDPYRGTEHPEWPATLADRVAEFDPSDAYHSEAGDLDARSYYAAIDRVMRLLRGDITDWTSPPA